MKEETDFGLALSASGSAFEEASQSSFPDSPLSVSAPIEAEEAGADLRSSYRRVWNLPVPLTPLIGRDHELEVLSGKRCPLAYQ